MAPFLLTHKKAIRGFAQMAFNWVSEQGFI